MSSIERGIGFASGTGSKNGASPEPPFSMIDPFSEPPCDCNLGEKEEGDFFGSDGRSFSRYVDKMMQEGLTSSEPPE